MNTDDYKKIGLLALSVKSRGEKKMKAKTVLKRFNVKSFDDFKANLECNYEFVVNVLELVEDVIKDSYIIDKTYFITNNIDVYEFDEEEFSEQDKETIKELSLKNDSVIYEFFSQSDAEANNIKNRFRVISYEDLYKLFLENKGVQ